MPSAGELAQCLLRKLRATETGGRHRTFEIYDDQGVLVARTWLSHSWRGNTPISQNMVRMIREQLGLQRSSDLKGLLDCTLTREGYLGLVG